MSRILIAIAAIGLLFGVMHAPVTEAANVSCNSSYQSTGGQYPAVIVNGAMITAVCVQAGGQTFTVIQGGSIQPIYGGCYNVLKNLHVVFTAQGANYNAECSPITSVTVRTVRMNASGR